MQRFLVILPNRATITINQLQTIVIPSVKGPHAHLQYIPLSTQPQETTNLSVYKFASFEHFR